MSETAATLHDKVSVYLGYGRATSALSDSGQEADVVDALNEGLRMAYYPQPQGTPYVWSFLQPRGTITTVAGTSTYSISGAPIGDFTWPTTSGNDRRIELIGEYQLRDMTQAQNPTNSFPCYVAATQSTAGAFTANFNCPFDDVYTITYAYRVIPSISGLTSNIYGGEMFGSLLTTACLAAAERMVNNLQGVNTAAFGERLQAAITQDMQSRPNHLGPYTDNPQMDLPFQGHRSVGIPTFYYNGSPT